MNLDKYFVKKDPIIPRTRLVGYTQIDLQEVKWLCEDIGAGQIFFEEFIQAYDVLGPPALASLYAKLCYRSFTLDKNMNLRGIRGVEDNIKGVIKSKHGAVLEHVVFNFVTIGCSRIFTHQLVRHRVGTAFSQTSGHYCTIDDAQMVLPQELRERWPTVAKTYETLLTRIKKEINACREFMKVDDMNFAERKKWTTVLRSILPDGADNEMGWSMNWRALRNNIELRTSRHNIWEIRMVFADVAQQLVDRWPLLLHGGTRELIDGYDEWTNLAL